MLSLGFWYFKQACFKYSRAEYVFLRPLLLASRESFIQSFSYSVSYERFWSWWHIEFHMRLLICIFIALIKFYQTEVNLIYNFEWVLLCYESSRVSLLNAHWLYLAKHKRGVYWESFIVLLILFILSTRRLKYLTSKIFTWPRAYFCQQNQFEKWSSFHYDLFVDARTD